MSKNGKIIIIGGGASGLAAALAAAKECGGRCVTVLERLDRVGKKLLATGNGRCNLTNLGADASHYHGAAPEFVKPALERFGVQRTLDYFRALGLLTVAEADGKVYPLSDQASSVLDVLRFAVEHDRVIRLMFMRDGRLFQVNAHIVSYDDKQVSFVTTRSPRTQVISREELLAVDFRRGDDGQVV